jgi:hypothetical protein
VQNADFVEVDCFGVADHRSESTAKMRDLGATRQLNEEQANFRMT